MIYRVIAAKWAEANGSIPRVERSLEGEFTFDELLAYNEKGYNCYYFPNYPSSETYAGLPISPTTKRKRQVKGSDVDTFEWVFVDLDMKDFQNEDPNRRHEYADKTQFIERVLTSDGLMPTMIVDSGNGVHAYWRTNGLDAKTFLRLNRRLCRHFHTDPAVSTLNQLMRVPNTLNVKDQENYKLAEVLWEEPENIYDIETVHHWLPGITPDDEAYCNQHYDMVHNAEQRAQDVKDIPAKFLTMVRNNKELRDQFNGPHKDRSAADFRLGIMLFDLGFTQDEAIAVLSRTAKASERSKVHQYGYAKNIVDKVWVEQPEENVTRPAGTCLAKSVKEILESGEVFGPRIPCHRMVDATAHGFRLGQVLGLIGGAGNGKSTTAMNLFRWFTELNSNKDYIHVYVSLEQPEKEISAKWRKMAAELRRERPDVDWDSVVYVVGNYNDDGTYRELGLDEIQACVVQLEKETGKKVGCLVVDHIGILKQLKGVDEFSGLIGICKRLKAFAIATNTFFVIQSQTSRAKNGGGDVELDMDAAFGTSNFEFFCDWILTTWQPLKRIYPRMTNENFLAVLAYKYAKIRHRDALADDIKQDTVYGMKFDPRTELLREMTSDQHKAFAFWQTQATQLRNRDKKKEPTPMAVVDWLQKGKSA